ncbi:MAG: tetratricopeptide repeat protein [Sphingomonadaceae bacterium]
MATTPPTNEAFEREVDDELRRDQLMSFWRNWGRWLIGAVLVGLAAFAGYLWWDHQQTLASGEASEQLSAAIESAGAGNAPAAKPKLDALVKSSGVGFHTTATLAQAAIALDNGDNKKAVTMFAGVAADSQAPQPLRDLALIRQTAAEFDTLKPEVVIARLRPLAVSGNPWFGSAGEMVAMSYLQMNKPDLAGKLFGDIGKDETVPETLRSRAIQMAGVLGVDAGKPAAKDKK